MRRNPQDYDVTDLFNELVDDAMNFEEYIDWVDESSVDWDRAEDSFASYCSVTRHWVEFVCEGKEYMVEDVFDYLVDNATGSFRAAIEADNYGYLTTFEDAVNILALVNCLGVEGILNQNESRADVRNAETLARLARRAQDEHTE